MEATLQEKEIQESAEQLPLLRQLANLRQEKKEIRGKLYDLQFDGLDEEGLESAKESIYADYEEKKEIYLSNRRRVKDHLVEKKLQIKEAKARYKAEIEEMRGEISNVATPEQIEQAKSKYEHESRAEKAHYEAESTRIKSEAAKIKADGKSKIKELTADYKAIKKTPMKRAEKKDKLDALKAEIYHLSGVMDLELLNKEHELKDLTAAHKTKLWEIKNDYDLVKDHLKTMVKNKKSEQKKELAPVREEADSYRQDYGSVANPFYKIGLFWRNWGIAFARRQKNAFSSWDGFKDWFVHNAVYLIIVALVVVTAIVSPRWLNFNSFLVIIKNTAALLPLSLGVAGCIVLAGTDLSLGRVWGLTALLSGILLAFGSTSGAVLPWTADMPWIWIVVVLVIVMAIGGLCGAFNGFFVAKFSIHPFIVTLASQLIVYGVILLLGDVLGFSVLYRDSAIQISTDYREFVSGGITIGQYRIENYVWYALIMIAVMWFIWNKTKFGKSMFAVGCNAEAANVSGISSFKTIVLTFMLAGICYGFGGFIYNPINGGAQLGTGQGGELDPITAAVIGGVSFTGGIGKISGVVLGSVLLKIIDSCLLALGATTQWINIVKGAIILVAVSLDMKKYVVKK